MNTVLWICGNTRAGKTWLARDIVREYGGIHLDGDEMRGCWTLSYDEDSRYENNLRVARIAKVIACQGYDVIVSTICPYRALRMMIDEILDVEWIELLGGKEPSEKYPYEQD